MVTDATKKLREPVAYLLLAFVGVYALASLLGLFVGDEFTSAARVVQGNLAAPGISGIALLLALVGAVFLVTEFGERTPNARTVTLAALALTGVLTLILLIAAIAGFSNDGDALPKIVGFLYDLGGLALYAVVGFLILRTLQALPAPAKAPAAAQGQGQGQFPGSQPQFGSQQPGYDQGQYGGGQYGGQQYAGQSGQLPQGQYGDQGQYGGQQGGYDQSQYGGYSGAYTAQQGADQGQSQSYGDPAAAASYGDTGTASSQETGQVSSEAGQSQWGQDAGQQSWGSADAGQSQWGQGGEAQQWPQAPSADRSAESPSAGQQWPADSGQQQWGADSGQQWGQQQGWGQQTPSGSQGWEQPANTGSGGGSVPSWSNTESGESADRPDDGADDATRIAPAVDAGDTDDDARQSENKDDGGQGWWSQPPR